MENIVLFLVGIIFGFLIAKRRSRNFIKEKTENNEENEEKILLRNGLGITRESDPNIAEQLVNIMNYNGESQTEDNK